MTVDDILRIRLFNEQLAQTKYKTPAEIVQWLGAVQSQDYPGAKWALMQRLQNSSEEAIEKAYNDGDIIRTHVMRPTWHFVSPKDIRWMLQLTAPRVKKIMAYYNRQLGLDEAERNKCNAVIEKTLAGKQLTREELSNALIANKIEAKGQRLGHIVGNAELDQLICSGPRRGKQFTYMLLEERVPKAKELDEDEALAELTLRYFTSHGPAQVKDFVWWSGLTTEQAKKGLEINKGKLVNETVEGKDYWFDGNMYEGKPMPDTVYLLPNYDEYGIAYKDRSAFVDASYNKFLDTRGAAIFSHMIFTKGRIAGLWRRTLKKDTVEVEIKPFRDFSKAEDEELHDAVKRYGEFLKLKPVLE